MLSIKLQDRGKFFIDSGEEVYGGQVVGEHVHDNDLVINVTKAKQLTNVRASGSDEKARVIPKTEMSLEECLEYIKGNEYVEVTPKNIRMRKITLDHMIVSVRVKNRHLTNNKLERRLSTTDSRLSSLTQVY